MKQQIITGLKKKLLLVELPEDATKDDLSFEQSNIDGNCLVYDCKYGCKKIHISQNISLNKIGKLTDIKEEKFEEIVQDHNGLYEYPDYTRNGLCFLPTAKESFFSKLEADGIYFENPLGKRLMLIDTWESKQKRKYNYLITLVEDYKKYKKVWQEAEEKVWDINRCWLFEVI